jgi:hypothetical protein
MDYKVGQNFVSSESRNFLCTSDILAQTPLFHTSGKGIIIYITLLIYNIKHVDTGDV